MLQKSPRGGGTICFELSLGNGLWFDGSQSNTMKRKELNTLLVIPKTSYDTEEWWTLTDVLSSSPGISVLQLKDNSFFWVCQFAHSKQIQTYNRPQESKLLRIRLINFLIITQRKVNAKAWLKTVWLVCAFVRPTSVQEEKGPEMLRNLWWDVGGKPPNTSDFD